jgi:hypothetical protein
LEFDCFSVRQLAPFRGTFQVIETEQTQAVTDDGESWRIQVKAMVPRSRWGGSEGGRKTQKTMLFGFWSVAGGLHRLPGNPLVDTAEVEQRVASLLEGLDSCASQLPFLPADNYELWLLDKHTRLPLALAASAKGSQPLKVPPFVKWQASSISDLSFIAPSMAAGMESGRPASTALGDDKARLQPHHRYRDRLEEIVRHAAMGAQWFQRAPNGSGLGLEERGTASELEGRKLSRDDFPELLIREAWPDEANQALVADYIAWQAPQLLTLHRLAENTRRRLEKLAIKSAIAVSKLHKLYPDCVDPALIKSALVEARLRQADS